jgi:hypothetical protein
LPFLPTLSDHADTLTHTETDSDIARVAAKLLFFSMYGVHIGRIRSHGHIYGIPGKGKKHTAEAKCHRSRRSKNTWQRHSAICGIDVHMAICMAYLAKAKNTWQRQSAIDLYMYRSIHIYIFIYIERERVL